MYAQGSVSDPYILTELHFDPTIAPGCKDIDGLTQVDSRQIAESIAVIVASGQSLLANYSQTSFIPANAKVQVLNIYNGGIYTVGAGPLPGAGNTLDNYAKRIADKMITAGKYARIVLVPIAMGSTSFANWEVGGPMNHRIGVAAARIAAAGMAATHVIWGQGESDNVDGTTELSCISSLQSIIATIRGTSMGNVPIYMAQESYYLGTTAANVTNAQAFVVGGSVFAGPNIDSLDASNRYDDIHLNATGADAAAALWAALLP